MLKEKDTKPIKYEGSDYSYQAIFDFINIYSETFVFKDDVEQDIKSSASRPWLNEKVPQLTLDSGNDICFSKEAALCIIYLVKDSSSKNAEVTE